MPESLTESVICHDNNRTPRQVDVAREVAVALSYDGTTHAVMMASPADLEDFATGFSLTEGIIRHSAEIEHINIVPVNGGIDVQLALTAAQRDSFRTRRRHMAGPVGCGLCGVESIAAALRPLSPVAGNFSLRAEDINAGIERLGGNQPLNEVTRCAHAAGFYRPDTDVLISREDVGRHNALDKVLGATLRGGQNPAQGIIVITSRLSVEIVQKAAIAGVPVIAAISAPTAEAICAALTANITLIARVRNGQFTIFTHPERILPA